MVKMWLAISLVSSFFPCSAVINFVSTTSSSFNKTHFCCAKICNSYCTISRQRSIFLCNCCSQQISEYTQLISWWISITGISKVSKLNKEFPAICLVSGPRGTAKTAWILCGSNWTRRRTRGRRESGERKQVRNCFPKLKICDRPARLWVPLLPSFLALVLTNFFSRCHFFCSQLPRA